MKRAYDIYLVTLSTKVSHLCARLCAVAVKSKLTLFTCIVLKHSEKAKHFMSFLEGIVEKSLPPFCTANGFIKDEKQNASSGGVHSNIDDVLPIRHLCANYVIRS